LAGSAILCYEELPEEEQEVYAIVKLRLCSMYELDASQAFDRFVTSRYNGEGVDVFVAQLRRYVSLIGLPRQSCDRLLVEQFLRAIPAEAARELRVISRSEGSIHLELSMLITNARHLASLKALDKSEMIGMIRNHNGPADIRRADRPTGSASRPFRPAGMPAPQARGPTSTEPSRGTRKLACFACSGDHMMKDCPLMKQLQTMQGNGVGPSWPAVSRAGPTAQPAQH
jgi:hypothetical protein